MWPCQAIGLSASCIGREGRGEVVSPWACLCGGETTHCRGVRENREANMGLQIGVAGEPGVRALKRFVEGESEPEAANKPMWVYKKAESKLLA